MLIECLGPSGIGKSTILREIHDLWKDHIIFPEDMHVDKSRYAPSHRIEFNDQCGENYINFSLHTISCGKMLIKQKYEASQGIFKSYIDFVSCKNLSIQNENMNILHDELCLHRADSILHFSPEWEKDAERYFSVVPTPDAAIVIQSSAEEIMKHISMRGTSRNCYYGLNDTELRDAVSKLLEIDRIGFEVLSARGVDVRVINTSSCSVDKSCNIFTDVLYDLLAGKGVKLEEKERYILPSRESAILEFKEKMRAASRSFKKKEGRHFLRNAGLIYCAFRTPEFSVSPDESQRSAERRFERFGLNESVIKGKSILDLGSNMGAMLFQATNYGLSKGVGLEYDADKVEIAREISRKFHIKGVSFLQGDIETFDFKKIGMFDIVLALSIEGHLIDADRLYPILGMVTKEKLFFEGNGNCNIERVKEGLEKFGFGNIRELGLCDDDIDQRNNNRPLIVAEKLRNVQPKINNNRERELEIKIKEVYQENQNLKEQIKEIQRRKAIFFNDSPIHFDELSVVDHAVDIWVEARESNNKQYVYKKLEARTFYSVEMECEGSFYEYTVRVYDTKLKSSFIERIYPVKVNIIFNFITNEDTEGLRFLVYAGIPGKTEGNVLHVKSFTVRKASLKDMNLRGD